MIDRLKILNYTPLLKHMSTPAPRKPVLVLGSYLSFLKYRATHPEWMVHIKSEQDCLAFEANRVVVLDGHFSPEVLEAALRRVR